MKKRSLGSSLQCKVLIAAMGVGAISQPVMAGAGDLVVRAGISAMDTDSGSDSFSSISRSGVQLDDAVTLSASAAYYLSDYSAIELTSSFPYQHDLEGNSRLKALGLGTLAEVKEIPTSLTINFYLNDYSAVTPYVGAGVAYTRFYDEDMKVTGLAVDFEDSVDLTAVAGVEMAFPSNLMVSFDLRYIDLNPTADFDGAVDEDIELDVDPVIFTLSAGYRF
ncbi:hypothetical protein BKP64_03450 [Marinobacter salinus]|uniref:Outer membrane protein OmpW n=1 Tax=Marinobacter salinus TaxID=1874317 RepID=A0A1D9GI35_9GAMM|nr:OmpW family outer membrane protein [Marinobacter salinus]AOY87316.1 hypothetical protein BKP64_03450 [Marinobacter salinus]